MEYGVLVNSAFLPLSPVSIRIHFGQQLSIYVFDFPFSMLAHLINHRKLSSSKVVGPRNKTMNRIHVGYVYCKYSGPSGFGD